MLQLMTDDGELDVTVTDVTEEHVTLDANHPLAGEDLTFDIELVEIC
jgi:peptidylprolyl isomerase